MTRTIRINYPKYHQANNETFPSPEQIQVQLLPSLFLRYCCCFFLAQARFAWISLTSCFALSFVEVGSADSHLPVTSTSLPGYGKVKFPVHTSGAYWTYKSIR